MARPHIRAPIPTRHRLIQKSADTNSFSVFSLSGAAAYPEQQHISGPSDGFSLSGTAAYPDHRTVSPYPERRHIRTIERLDGFSLWLVNVRFLAGKRTVLGEPIVRFIAVAFDLVKRAG